MKKLFVLLILVVAVLGCKRKLESKKPSVPQASTAASETKTPSAAQTDATGWVKVELGSKKSARDIYIDASTVSDEGDYRKAWVLYDNRGEPINLGGASYLSRKALYLFSCRNKSGAYTSESLHKEAMGRGDVVFSQNIEQPKWLPGVSGTVFEATIEAACKLVPTLKK